MNDARNNLRAAGAVRTWRIGRLVLTVLVLAFVGWSVRSAFRNLDWHDLQPRGAPLSIGAVLFALYLLGNALLWHWLTRRHDVALPLRSALAIWFYSTLGKYVPGKALLWGIRYVEYRARRPSLSTPAFLRCCFLEFFATTAAGLTLALVGVLFVPLPGLAGAIRIGAGIALGVSLLGAHPALLAWGERRLTRGLSFRAAADEQRQSDTDPGGVAREPFSLVETVLCVALYAMNWLLLGGAVYWLACALQSPQQQAGYWVVTLAYALAGVVGFLALFAPAGLGVREGMLISALAPAISLETATLLAILARVVCTVVEVLLGLAAPLGDALLRRRRLPIAD